LSQDAKKTAINNGWIDITRDQEARNRAAEDLIEKVLDERTKDHWTVIIRPTNIDYADSRPRTNTEGVHDEVKAEYLCPI
jgi:hypothetical protein